MKKFLSGLLAFASVLVSCSKPAPYEPKVFTVTSPAEYTVPAEGDVYTIEFTTNTDWTASLNCDAEVASVSPAQGTSADTRIKVTVQKYDKTNELRSFKLNINPKGGAPASIAFTQAGPFDPYFELKDTPKKAVAAEGGSVSFTINTNCKYTLSWEETVDWAEAAIEETKCTVTFKEYKGIEARSISLLFTVPEIQVDELDGDGNKTGNKTDMIKELTISQDGLSSTVWSMELPAAVIKNAVNFSLAMFRGVLWVSNGTEKLFSIDPAKGTVVETLDAGAVITSICSDDAGNLILASGGDYTEGLYIYTMKPTSLNSTKDLLVYWPNGYYGYGVNNICAKGDVYGQAVVTMYGAGAPQFGGMNICCYWNVGNGMAKWEKNGEDVDVANPSVIAPEHLGSTDIWSSVNCIFAPAGSKTTDGFYFAGYDGVYNLFFYDGSAWSTVVETGSSWAEGYNSFDSIVWNGDTYSVLNAVAYFPKWGMPSSIFVNKGIGSKLENLGVIQYTGPNAVDASVSAIATGTELAVEDGDLCIYTIDGSWGVMSKIKIKK